MTNTIFDLVEEEIPEGARGFMELANRAPSPKSKSFLDDIADYGKSFLKGTVEGLGKLGRIMGPTGDFSRGATERQLQQQTETLDELLPTEEESFTQRAFRKGLSEIPTALSFPGSTLATLPRAIASGFLGEGAKDLGLPEWAQTAAELTAYIGPDILKGLLSSGKDKEIIDAARKFGLNDKEITPLIQSEFKQKWLSKLVPRRGSTESSLAKTKSKLAETYGIVQKSEDASKVLTNDIEEKLISSLRNKFFNMPSGVRKKVLKDFKDLQAKPITGETLINFYTDINSAMGSNSKQLSLLKEPIKQAIHSISPGLAKDFDMINLMYSKYYPIASRLKPNLTSDIIGAAESLAVLGSAFLGPFVGFAPLVHIAGEKTVRKLAQQVLLNPHFQQLGKKMTIAMNENKYQLAKKLSSEMSKEIRKVSPEIADKIDELSIEELEDFLKNHQEKEGKQ